MLPQRVGGLRSPPGSGVTCDTPFGGRADGVRSWRDVPEANRLRALSRPPRSGSDGGGGGGGGTGLPFLHRIRTLPTVRQVALSIWHGTCGSYQRLTS